MTLYLVPARSPYQRAFRSMAASAILLLLIALVLSIWTPVNMTDRTLRILGWLTGALVLGAALAAYWLGIRESLWKANRNYCLESRDGKLIQHRHGSPMVEIPIDQIDAVQSRHWPLMGRWLFIKGEEPERRIAVPPDVLGIEDLRRELSASREILRLRPNPRSFLIPALFLVASCFLLLSHDRAIVLVQGAQRSSPTPQCYTSGTNTRKMPPKPAA